MMTIKEYVEKHVKEDQATKDIVEIAIEDFIIKSELVRRAFIEGLTETDELDSVDIDGIEEDYIDQLKW